MTDARYVIRGGEAGYERLQALARTVAPSTGALFDRVGLRDGMRCCDLGCGPGVVSFTLVERVAPSGEVVGVDMDEVKLDLARREAAERGITNITFRAGDVTAWDEPAPYDVVYARFLLQHLKHPRELLAPMWAGVRPGGVLIVEDSISRSRSASRPGPSSTSSSTLSETLRRRDGDPIIGRSLYRYATEVGVREPQLSMAQHVEATGEAKTMMWRTLDATADSMVAEGVATREQIAEASDVLAAATADADTIIGGPATFQIWARKPSSR